MKQTAETTMDVGDLMSNLSVILKNVSSDLATIEKVLADCNHPNLKLLQGMDMIDQIILNLAGFLNQLSHECEGQDRLPVADPLTHVTLEQLRAQIIGLDTKTNTTNHHVDFF